MFSSLLLNLKRLTASKNHSGAAESVSILKLMRNGAPYFLNRQGYARYPLTIFMNVNGKCNLNCRLCDVGQKKRESMFYQNLKGDSSPDFPIERFKKLIDEVSFFNPYISLTTTEPLMYPYLFDAVRYGGSKNISMNVTTNGILLERRIDEILNSGLHRISISLDGPAAIHDTMRGTPGAYEKVLRGLNLLLEEKKRRGLVLPHVFITTYICDTNYAHLTELLEGLPLEGIEKINIKLMLFVTKKMVEDYNRKFEGKHKVTVSCLPEDFKPENIDVRILYGQIKEIQRRFGNVCAFHFTVDKNAIEKYYYRPHEFMDNTRCVLPWFVAQITARGDLIPQTRCYGTTYGNIMDKPFLEVWNGPEVRAFRRDLQKFGRFPACARCDGVLFR